MGELIDGLLRFSQLSRQSLKRQPVNMEMLARESLQDLQTQIAGRQIQIRVGELPPFEGDRTLLKQVWVNLLSNAIKYSRKRETGRRRDRQRHARGSGGVFRAR